jgi:hypothetical protein
MAEKSILDYSTPSADNVRTGPAMDLGAAFELKPALINMVRASPLCGNAHEDAHGHLQQFLALCSTIRNVEPSAICLRLFPFSLLGKAKQWFYAHQDSLTTWDKCSRPT